jgi:hypothetical protein
MQKLYCFVDESGQDSVAQPGKKLALFVVAIVMVSDDQLSLKSVCEQYEQRSRKRASPWHKARYDYRLAYIRRVVGDKRFRGVLHYQFIEQPAKAFFDSYTLQGIANILSESFKDDAVLKEIYVDGLTRSKQADYGIELRRMGARRATFHRITDQASAFIRLADALAGLVREAEEEPRSNARTLLSDGQRRRIVTWVL